MKEQITHFCRGWGIVDAQFYIPAICEDIMEAVEQDGMTLREILSEIELDSLDFGCTAIEAMLRRKHYFPHLVEEVEATLDGFVRRPANMEELIDLLEYAGVIVL